MTAAGKIMYHSRGSSSLSSLHYRAMRVRGPRVISRKRSVRTFATRDVSVYFLFPGLLYEQTSRYLRLQLVVSRPRSKRNFPPRDYNSDPIERM